MLGQYDELVGYPSTTTVAGGGKVVKAFDISLHLPSWDGPTAAVGGLCIVALLIAKRSRLRPFADIVAMVLGVAVVAGLGLDSVETVGDIATIPTGLDAIPTPAPAGPVPGPCPHPCRDRRRDRPARRGGDGRRRVPESVRSPVGHEPRLVAQGAANVAGGFFRALPAGGSLSRTGVNVSAGGRSRWAGVAAGGLLVVLVALAGSVAELIPMTTLAAILMVIGVEALTNEVRHLVEARWVSWPHVGAAVVTVVVGLVSELTAAIFTGVALSLLLYMLSIGDRARLTAWRWRDGGGWEEVDAPEQLPSGQVTVLALTGAAYFASAYRADQAMPAHDTTTGAAVVLQLRDRIFYSLTGIDWLKAATAKLQSGGNRVLIADIDPSQRTAMDRTGLLAVLGEDGVVWRDPVIGAAAAEAARRAETWLAQQRAVGPQP